MSGLAALFHRDGRPVEAAAVWGMLTAAPYRGPDGMWVGCWDSVALGYAKMAVTPEEEHEQQPLVSPRSGCALIADVRLDNREDLLATLPERLPPTASDAELILRAVEAWGLDAVERLLGDFAFVLWDPRQQRLVCARDTSGQRGLFYRVDQRTFVAASEIQQLLQDPALLVAPNEERVREFLVPLNTFQNEKQQAATFYEGICAVPPGHMLVVDRAAVRVRQYWKLEPPQELRYRTDDEYAEHYLALFSQVVQARLRSSRPVGLMLSGGLDSSSVACVAQELYRAGRAVDHGFTGFTSVFDGLDCDERLFIEDIQDKYGFEVHYVSTGAFGGRLQLEPWGFQEAPNMGIPEGRDAIYGAMARAGVRAVLNGHTADACVSGSRLVFDSLLRQGRLGAFRQHLQAYRRLSNESLHKIVALYCLAPLLPRGVQTRLEVAYAQRVFKRIERRLLPSWMPDPLRQDLNQRHLRLSVEAERRRRFSNPMREEEYRLLYPPEVTRHPVPWPLETWRPFADRRLHEFLLAIPPEQKFAPHPDTDNLYAGQKRIVRRAMRGILPESIRTRTLKTVFHGVWESEIDRQWPLYEAAFGPSARPEIVARGYVNQERFWSRLTGLRGGKYGNDFAYVMNMVALETWLRALKLPRPQLVTVPPPWQERLLAARRHRNADVRTAIT